MIAERGDSPHRRQWIVKRAEGIRVEVSNGASVVLSKRHKDRALYLTSLCRHQQGVPDAG